MNNRILFTHVFEMFNIDLQQEIILKLVYTKTLTLKFLDIIKAE